MVVTTKQPQRIFVKAFYEHWLSMQPGLTLLEDQILKYLCARMDISNEVVFGSEEMEELAKMIGSTKRSIQSTFSKLLKRQPALATKVKYYTYMVCPDLGIKHQDFDKIQFLFEAYINKDGVQAMERRISIFSKGKEKVLRTTKEDLYFADKSKFI